MTNVILRHSSVHTQTHNPFAEKNETTRTKTCTLSIHNSKMLINLLVHVHTTEKNASYYVQTF